MSEEKKEKGARELPTHTRCLIYCDRYPEECPLPNIQQEETWGVKTKFLAGFTTKTLWAQLKIRLLSKLAFKGKFLGLRAGSRLLSLDEYLQELPAEVSLAIEYMSYSFADVCRSLDTFIPRVRAWEGHEHLAFRLRRDFTYSTEAIEGGTLTKEEVDEAVRQPLKDIVGERLEAKIHFDLCTSQLPHRAEEITPEVLFRLHKLVAVIDLPEEKRGLYRVKNVYIKTNPHKFVVHEKVPEEMDAFFKWLHSRECQKNAPIADVIKFACDAHYRLVHIHPFSDGNGRMCRLVMNVILLEHDLPLVSIMPQVRDLYFASLGMLDKAQDARLLERIVAEAAVRSVDMTMCYLSGNGRPSASASPPNESEGQ